MQERTILKEYNLSPNVEYGGVADLGKAKLSSDYI